MRLEQAASLIGVVDEEGVLEYGECFVQLRPPQLDLELGVNSSESQILEEIDVIVSRSPAHHPGDVRKLRAVRRGALEHLVNVIVFPSRGPRPHPAEMSAGDLDGDKYLIIWDASIVAATTPVPACAYEPKAHKMHMHMQLSARKRQQQQRPPPPPTAAGPMFLRASSKPPRPPPSRDEVARDVMADEARQQSAVRGPTSHVGLAELVRHGHPPPRRQPRTDDELLAESALAETLRAAQEEEAQRRLERTVSERDQEAERACHVHVHEHVHPPTRACASSRPCMCR